MSGKIQPLLTLAVMKILNCYITKVMKSTKMLCQIDLLITEYSSIISDFLIFNKPIIFAKFDHDYYIKTKGVYVDYDNNLPEPKANNWSEITQYIKTIFMDKNDEYQKERNNLRTLIYPNLDGDACKRITQSVMSLND